MPHDSAPAPVPLSLGMPPAVARALTDGLVRAVSAVPGVPVLEGALSDAAVAEFLVGIAHADTGFVVRTESADRAVAIVAGTVAALCGDDIRGALTAPDLGYLRGLRPAAVEALREVLLAVESATPEVVAHGLGRLGPVDPDGRPADAPAGGGAR